MTPAFVTPAPWAGGLVHPMYGTADTYQMAAEWLKDCADVADWGGGTGMFRNYLPATVRYAIVDGTLQSTEQRLVDLEQHAEPADGILIRHVLDINLGWREILDNAVKAFRRRMVVITFTPDRAESRVMKMKSGWPVIHFNPADIRERLRPFLVRDEVVQTSHPERVYFLERAA